MRALLAAFAAALVTLITIVLAWAILTDAWLDPGGCLVTALAVVALWLGLRGLGPLIRREDRR